MITVKKLLLIILRLFGLVFFFEINDFDLSAYEIAEVIPLDELEINDILTNRFEEEHVLDYLNENIEDFETFNLEDNE